MKRPQAMAVRTLMLSLLLFLTNPVLADVTPGDVIDKTNWQKVEGLLPAPVLAWVKQGKVVLNIGELSYEPRDYFPPFVLEAREGNRGRYALDDDHWIVEAKTGKRTEYIIGIPFPEIDPADPKAGEKVMYNNKYVQYCLGDMRLTQVALLIGQSGYERRIRVEALNTAMDGNPKYAERENPSALLKQQLGVVRDPYDMAGAAVMTWRYRDPAKEDLHFGYLPAIRRVRRMSPANRSDALFGGDSSNDDVALYDGKMAAMEWKLLRKQAALLPFSDSDPALLEQNKQGEWQTTNTAKALIYGYEQEGWQGAPWAPVNWVWVKCPTYVIEMRPKDRYYNYGTQHLWVCAEVYSPAFKIINDRSGKYWKTIFKSRLVGKSTDERMHLTILGDTLALDERRNHATIGRGVDPKNIYTYFANTNINCFSLAGFQKFCK